MAAHQHFETGTSLTSGPVSPYSSEYAESEQYQRLCASIHQRLAQTRLERAAKNGGARLNEDGSLSFESFGATVTVRPGANPSSFVTEGALGMWHELVLLQYLADGSGREPEDRTMGLTNFGDGGLLRGPSFDKEVRQVAASQLSSFSQAQIARGCRALGGVSCESMGDLTYSFFFAPNFPMQALIWVADDEFPASAKVLFDGSAEYYLGVEAAGAVAVILMKLIAHNTDIISIQG